LHSVLYKKTKFDRLYTILQKNGGTDTKAMGQTEPQFLSDPMSDRKKKVFANSEIAQIFIKHNAATKVLTFPTTDIGHPSFS
jgi:hypothetical protein